MLDFTTGKVGPQCSRKPFKDQAEVQMQVLLLEIQS